MDLFSTTSAENPARKASTPLAERVRPRELSEVLSQDKLVGPKGPLSTLLETKQYHSFVLWGPPGTGKTTIARILAEKSGLRFVPFSAVLSGIKEVKEVMARAEYDRTHGGKPTIVFVDEIHRFNKAQQDAFLPYVERGDVLLIGATTENPSFEVISALLSRVRVYVVKPLTPADQVALLRRATEMDEILKNRGQTFSDDVLEYLAAKVPGDARAALNLLEATSFQESTGGPIAREAIDRAAQRTALLYDKEGEEHYNIISALHKSMRNGDPDAALYWLGRMLEAGEDPLYVVRRMIRFASEDIGNADPQALILAMAAQQAVHFIGMPEGKLALAQLAIYLSLAPKSNSVYIAYGRVESDIEAGRVYPVPLEIRNAPTKLMKELEYGKGYEYSHDYAEKTTALECMPKELAGRKYWEPEESGLETELGKRRNTFEEVRKRLRAQRQKPKGN